MKKYFIALSVLLALAAGAIAGNITSPGDAYPSARTSVADEKDIQTAAFRSALAGADTLTTTAILATTEFRLVGRPIVRVSIRFSNSGANCKIRLAYIYKTALAGTFTDAAINLITGYSDERTVTAGTIQYEASYYPTVAGDEYFDGAGAVAVRVIVTQAPSAGTVTMWVGSK